MISESVWNLGANKFNNPDTLPYGLPTKGQYNAERGTITFKNSKSTTWTGKVGLIYASDYGYASTDTECQTDLRAGITYTNNTYDYTNAACKNNNWLQKNSNYWTISPSYSDNRMVYHEQGNGCISSSWANTSTNIFPSIYLLPNIIIANGYGSIDNPYVFE